MSQRAWAEAARKFRKVRKFPRNYQFRLDWLTRMNDFNEGFLQGYNASNVMHSKKKVVTLSTIICL
jgi:hypothetical protein